MPVAILKSGAWRRVRFSISIVRPDDYPHKCIGCYTPVVIGERVITQRSASEKSPKLWGPIEEMVHLRCWETVPPHIRPPLGPQLNLWLKYGDLPWLARW